MSTSDVSDVTMWALLTPTLERFWNDWSLPAGNAFDVPGRGQNRCFAVTTAEKTASDTITTANIQGIVTIKRSVEAREALQPSSSPHEK
ncbi:hypothetical protein CGMCC3_g8347 [Colletotrichum fructicola]|nr:uncharacterized protein CGMCC3_g8347 [Colletotrichum fructicola]KAE9575507.1 hypothetical protein CGMCC3_g8347 [Colletotrichum fructicola]